MARGAWGPAASLLATLTNIHKSAKTPPLSPDECNPFSPQPEPMRISAAEAGRIIVDAMKAKR